ncbi:MAG TPA: hypothetical protein VM735_10005 [Candidatus Kapabacteria bacterium]|nr:hypothetical protein [Candidatus Kapabacteria bacterium]
MEQLIIFLLFVVGSIISSIIQNKKKKAEEQQQRELEELTGRPQTSGQTTSPKAPSPAWPQTGGDWQEQLRRLLQGESLPPQAPPPVFKPVLLPPEKTRTQQQPQRKQPRYDPKRQGKQQVQPPSPPPVTSRPRPALQEASEGEARSKSPLPASTTRYETAAGLHESVEKRMRHVVEQTTTHKKIRTSGRGPSRRSLQSDFVKRLRRNPRAVREAFVASVIFGPPKSLENEPNLVG